MKVEMESKVISKLDKWQPKSGPLIISGPCSAETEEQLISTAKLLADSGKVHVLRAGIWKPRTRPNSFEGIGVKALKWLREAKEETGLPTAVEVANAKHVEEALYHGVDILWIGARTSVNPFSVQEIADALKGVDTTVLVKNPINPDLDLWMGAMERILKAGVDKVGAIHRGFSKYGDSKYRNIPQWQIPVELKRRIPEITMICDPSHICGNRKLLQSVSQKAIDLNFDGLMLESHICPDEAWSDKNQQVTPEELVTILSNLVYRRDDIPGVPTHILDELREEIDQIDDDLLNLLSARMDKAESIGQFKKDHGITILQSTRWDEIVTNRVIQGEKIGLSEEFIRKYLEVVHQESINHQNRVMNRS